jgi:hypothetical protein
MRENLVYVSASLAVRKTAAIQSKMAADGQKYRKILLNTVIFFNYVAITSRLSAAGRTWCCEHRKATERSEFSAKIPAHRCVCVCVCVRVSDTIFADVFCCRSISVSCHPGPQKATVQQLPASRG